MVTDGASQRPTATAARVPEAPVVAQRVTDEDGHLVEVFPLTTAEGTQVLPDPDWSRLALWDELRRRYAGIPGPDPVDRSGTGFATTDHLRCGACTEAGP